MKIPFRLTGVLALFLSAPLAAATPSTAPTPKPVPLSSKTVGARPTTAHPRNDLASAERTLVAAKRFLSTAPNDNAGHRLRAQQAVESALIEVSAAIRAAAGK